MAGAAQTAAVPTPAPANKRRRLKGCFRSVIAVLLNVDPGCHASGSSALFRYAIRGIFRRARHSA